jgi:hypothetical protein
MRRERDYHPLDDAFAAISSPVGFGRALCAGYLLGFLGFRGAMFLCGCGFVASIRRNTSSSRF